MKVVSVNVGMPREVLWKGMTVQTGIFKQPVEGRVRISKLNLAGDSQADLTVHGGEEKAVYAYPAEHYAYWRQELPEVPFSWGMFGENLTTEGLSEDSLCVGDRLGVGTAVLQVTQPRVPCYKMALIAEAKPKYGLMYALMAGCSLRMGEVTAIRVEPHSDVHSTISLDCRTIHVRKPCVMGWSRTRRR